MMNPLLKQVTFTFALFSAVSAHAETIQLGHIKFLANTNVKMFKFTGEAKEISSNIVRTGEAISSFDLRIPVKSIKTGMDVRDKHMQERIFTAKDGTLPDITYQSKKFECKQGSCDVTGNLTIRGETKPFPLKVTLKDGTQASGSADIDVLEFGVKPELLQYSEIKVDSRVRLEFEVKTH